MQPPREGAACEKAQTLYWRNGYAVVVPNPPTRSAAVRSPGQRGGLAKQPTAAPAAPPAPVPQPQKPISDAPGWIKHAGEVLRFSAYFVEELAPGHSAVEGHRIRAVTLLHYLEDGTTQVIEPRKGAGEGMYPGVLVRRARLPAPGASAASEPAPLTAAHLFVGATVPIYGRKYHVIDADGFTRSWLATSGRPQGAPLPLPPSPYAAHKARAAQPSGLSRSDPESPTRFAEILAGRDPVSKKLQQFLAGNGAVLRFMAVWDDPAGAPGSSGPIRRPYKVLYYLEDDTVEVIELKEGNGGREFYRFLARAPLPKRRAGEGPRVVPGGTLSRENCVSPADCRIGGTLEVHGRSFFLHDADDWTKRWCVENLGWGPEETVAVDVTVPALPPAPRELPPHNGFGDPEDSARNCRRLVPSAPRPQRRALLSGLEDSNAAALRFVARLADRPGRPRLSAADGARSFVLSFFLADATLAVFEQPVPNSGVVGGKYLERCKAFKPSGGGRLTESDLWVGATIELAGRLFELVDADEWTMKTMEREAQTLFPKADGAAALAAICAAGEGLAGVLHDGALGREDFCVAVEAAVPELTKHEAIAAFRQLQRERESDSER